MKKSTLLAILIGLQTTLAPAATCTDLGKSAAAAETNSRKQMETFKEGVRSHLYPLCSAFGVDKPCAELYTLITQVTDEDAYGKAFLPLFKKAIADMDQKSRMTFRDLIFFLRDLYKSSNALSAQATQTREKMVTQKCGPILNLVGMSDVALVSESAKSKTGQCKVIPVKIAGHTEYVISVGGEDYPIKGVTYSSISETAKSLREALDSGSCL